MIGSLEGKAAEKPATAAATAETPKAAPAVVVPAITSAVKVPEEKREPLEPFGELIPFGDPSWYQGVCILPPPSFEGMDESNDIL